MIKKEHSKAHCNKIVNFLGKDPKRFKNLIDAFLTGPYRITQRAAWPLSYCVELHPELIKPHLKRVLKYAKKPDVHDAVKRNIIRLLQFIEIPKSMQGVVVDVCFTFLKNPKESVAIRIFAITVLTNLSNILPELKNELIPIIEDQLPYGSAGFISRGRKALLELKKLN